MTSVPCGRHVLQAAILLGLGLIVATQWGCGDRGELASSGTPTQEATGSETGSSEKPPAEKPPGEKPPGETAPGEKGPGETPTAEEGPGEKPPAEEPLSNEPLGPTKLPTPQWLPEPISVPEAVANTEAEMKPYTEEIPRTDATFEMVPIPGGTFVMGSPDDEEDRNDDEGPQHEVSIEPFWMGKCEVTWDEYELWGLSLDLHRRQVLKIESTERDELVDAIARPTAPYSDMTFGMGSQGYPAICMTQFAAKMYCKWLSAKTGRYYRLPTEAEWEYACRAGTTTAYCFGDDPEKLDDYGWYFDNGDDKYHKVGQKKPNPWGLHDMHGNVCEWVLDQHIPEFYQQFAGRTAKDPLAQATAIYPRVVRGGSWVDDPEQLRSAARMGSNKDWKMQDCQIPQSIWYHTDADFLGFRVVRPLLTPTSEEAKRYEPDAVQWNEFDEYQEAQAGKQ